MTEQRAIGRYDSRAVLEPFRFHIGLIEDFLKTFGYVEVARDQLNSSERGSEMEE